MKYKLVLTSAVITGTLWIIVGCSLIGKQPTPPTAAEQYLYDVVTNEHNSYSYTPSNKVTENLGGFTQILNLLVPGSQGIATTGILLLLTIWGKLRSTKLGNTVGATTQEIETLREFIKNLPGGEQYDSVIVQFLQKHQMDANVLNTIIQFLQTKTSNGDARLAAQSLSDTLNNLQQTYGNNPKK